MFKNVYLWKKIFKTETASTDEFKTMKKIYCSFRVLWKFLSMAQLRWSLCHWFDYLD